MAVDDELEQAHSLRLDGPVSASYSMGASGTAKGRPWQYPVAVRRALRRAFGPGTDGERKGKPAVHERNAGVRGDGDGSTDAGDHLEEDRRRRESLGFLAFFFKNKRTPPISPLFPTTTPCI